MKGCVSFSLYGDAAKYSFGALENVRLAREFYPGWTVVVHIDTGHYAIESLRAAGAEVHEMTPQPGSRGMFWRFLPGDWEDRFTHVVIRDADSRINPREQAAVAEWIKSEKSLHIMRDNEWHYAKPIMGGAWGVRTGAFDFQSAINEWAHTNEYGDDEDFLWRLVWEHFRASGDFIRHARWVREDIDQAFPAHSPYNGFVCEQIVPQLNEPFDALVLSPDKYAQRREKFFESLDQHGGFLRGNVEWSRASTTKDRVIPKFFPHADLPHYYLATRDHTEILEQGYLSGKPYLFVFEDDAQFTPDFEEQFLRAYVGLPSHWRGLYLGWQGDNPDKDKPVNSALSPARGLLGMHGIFWNRSGMLRAFEHLSLWNQMTVDQVLRGLQNDEPDYYFATPTWAVHISPEAKQFGEDT